MSEDPRLERAKMPMCPDCRNPVLGEECACQDDCDEEIIRQLKETEERFLAGELDDCPCEDPVDPEPKVITLADLAEAHGLSLDHEGIVDDPVGHPAHYTRGKYECIDVIADVVKDMHGMDAWITGQVIKYMWRWPFKGERQDLEKARFYLDWYLNHAQ